MEFFIDIEVKFNAIILEVTYPNWFINPEKFLRVKNILWGKLSPTKSIIVDWILSVSRKIYF